MKKSHLLFLVAFFGFFAWLSYLAKPVKAVLNERPEVAGKDTAMLAVKVESTKTYTSNSPSFGLRNVRASDDGMLKTRFVMRYSSITESVSPSCGAIYNGFTQDVSTIAIAADTNTHVYFNFNPNVFTVAWPTNPVILGSLYVSNVDTRGLRVRIWDSRGDTTTVKAFFDRTFTADQANPIVFNQEFSSGITTQRSSSGTVVTSWDETFRK